MSSKRVVDAFETTDKDYLNWKMRFKTAAGAFEQGKFKDARDLMFRALYPNLVRALNAYADALRQRGLTEELSDAKEKFSALMRATAVK